MARTVPVIFGIKLQLESQVDRELKKASKSIGALEKDFRAFERAIFRFNTVAFAAQKILFGAAALTGAFVAATKVAGDFEEQILVVAKTTGLGSNFIGQMTGRLIDLSKQIPLTTSELSEIAINAGRMGLAVGKSAAQAAEDITQFTETIGKAALATTLSVDKASVAAARLGRVFGLDVAKQSVNLLSAMNSLENQTVSTANEIVQVSLRLAPVAALMGLTADETLGFAAALKEAGVTSQVAGTNLAIIMQRMARDVSGFARVAGVRLGEFKNLVRDDMSQALVVFSKGLLNVADDNIKLSKTLKQLGLTGTRVSLVAGALARASADQGDQVSRLEQILGLANKEFKAGTSLQREFEKQMQGLNAQFKLLVNTVTSFVKRVGLALAPVMKIAIQIFTVLANVLNFIPMPVLTVIGALGLLAGIFGIVVAGAIILTTTIAIAMLSIAAFGEMVLRSTDIVTNGLIPGFKASVGVIGQFIKRIFTAGIVTNQLKKILFKLSGVPLFPSDFIPGIKTSTQLTRTFQLAGASLGTVIVKTTGFLSAQTASLAAYTASTGLATGATTAFSAAQNSVSGFFVGLKPKLKTAGDDILKIGTNLSTSAQNILGFEASAKKGFSGFISNLFRVQGAILGKLVGPIKILTTEGFGAMIKSFGAAGGLLSSLSAGLGAFAAAFGPIIAVVLVIIGIVQAIRENFLGIGDAFSFLMNSIRDTLGALAASMGFVLEETGGGVKSIGEILSFILTRVMAPFIAILKVFFLVLGVAFRALAPVLAVVGGVIGLIARAVEFLVEIIESAVRAIQEFIKPLRDSFAFLAGLPVVGAAFELLVGVGPEAEGIPGAADGGVVQNRTIIEVAEKGPEAIIPLDRLPQIAAASGPSSMNLNISLNVDGREIGRAVAAFSGEESQRLLNGREINLRGLG